MKNIQKNQSSYLHARIKSFQFSFSGIKQFFKTEPNSWLHLCGTVVAVCGILILNLSKVETALIVFSIGLVWVSEILNTCIEKIMDFISIEKNDQIKVIKDMASGAVLIAAIVALITGLIIFIPKIIL